MELNKQLNIGRMGENTASEFLIKNGHKILIRNYRQKFDEIDIIARAGDRMLVFYEVKALLVNNIDSTNQLMPEDNLTSAKLRKLRRACRIFAEKHPELIDPEMGWRIDLVAVEFKRNGPQISLKEIRCYENIA